jgi:hypothetical protein
MKTIILGCVAVLVLLGAARSAAAQGRKLTDEELDKVSAGSTSPQGPNVATAFSFQGQAGQSHTVQGNGTIAIQQGNLPSISSSLILSDNAQQNLHSLISINAVNSQIQVLLNLNININSTVGAVHQGNASLGH